MKTHIFFTLLMTVLISSCASHEGRGVSSVHEQDAQDALAPDNYVSGNQADRFR